MCEVTLLTRRHRRRLFRIRLRTRARAALKSGARFRALQSGALEHCSDDKISKRAITVRA